MAIVAQQIVEGRRFNGWLDPRYPIGYWQGALNLTGDASGGVLTISLLFQQANGPERLNSQLYSVERLSVQHSANSGKFVKLDALNMAGPSNLGFEHAYAVRVELITGRSEAVIDGGDLTFLPWFLGSQRLAGITAALSMSGDNIDGEEYKFEAEGYRWGARSVLADGGPQRPPTGPYGR